MAKVKFGAIVTDMRNKLGSSVFSRNRYGAYSRSYKVNVPSTTAAQEAAKTRLTDISTAWKGLTQIQRDQWNSSVSDFLHTDIFGAIVRPSGFNLFMKVNVNRSFIDLEMLTEPPQPDTYTLPVNPAISINTADETAVFSFDNDTSPPNAKWLLFCTAPISPGITYVKNRVRFIKAIDESLPSSVSFWTEYVAKFGAPAGGTRVSFSVACLIDASGQKSAPMYGTCIVSDIPTPPTNSCPMGVPDLFPVADHLYYTFYPGLVVNVNNLSLQARQGSDPFVEYRNVTPVPANTPIDGDVALAAGFWDLRIVCTYNDSSTEVVETDNGIEIPSE